MTASRQAAPVALPEIKERAAGWRVAVDFTAIGVMGYAVWALFGAAREERLQRDAAVAEQRRLRLAMRDLHDKLAALAALPTDAAPSGAANALSTPAAKPAASARGKSSSSSRAPRGKTSRSRKAASDASGETP